MSRKKRRQIITWIFFIVGAFVHALGVCISNQTHSVFLMILAGGSHALFYYFLDCKIYEDYKDMPEKPKNIVASIVTRHEIVIGTAIYVFLTIIIINPFGISEIFRLLLIAVEIITAAITKKKEKNDL